MTPTKPPPTKKPPPPPPQTVEDLTTSQLRYLLLAKLPPGVGVEAWGADRETLLEIAAGSGLHALSAEDIEEVGPRTEVTAQGRAAKNDMESRLARTRMRREVDKKSSSWKFSAQMILVALLSMVHAGKFEKPKQWLGLAPPPPPVCPAPKWWQHALPWAKPGARGECEPRPSEKQRPRARRR